MGLAARTIRIFNYMAVSNVQSTLHAHGSDILNVVVKVDKVPCAQYQLPPSDRITNVHFQGDE